MTTLPIIQNGYEAFCATISEDNIVKVYSIREEDDEEEEHEDQEEEEHGNPEEQGDDQEDPTLNWFGYKFDEERVGYLRMSVKAIIIFKGSCTCEDFPERKQFFQSHFLFH
jgi:hypothetical protein